jgi:hypothetical protein
MGGETFISVATQPSIPTLRRCRDIEKALVKSFSIWSRNQRKKSKTLIELRGNPSFSITRKKFRLSIQCYF